MPSSEGIGAVVIGAGPYGLATSSHLRARGVDHRALGTPMAGWFEHMPAGMFLKSTARDSSIGSPDRGTGIGDWCRAAGVEPFDAGGGEIPIPVADFIEYGRWFQEHEVPELEKGLVSGISRAASGFDVELTSGERLRTATVVVAIGTAPFAYMPAELRSALDSDWAPGRISHSSDHHDLSRFSGKTVAVIGAGQSALETAVLLHESAASVHLLVRSPAINWGGPPVPGEAGPLHKLRRPPSVLGDGWTHRLVTRHAASYRRLPDRVRLAGVRTILGPSGAWWLKRRFDGVDVHLETRVTGVDGRCDGVRVDTIDGEGIRSSIEVDHVIAATGFRVDVTSLEVLSNGLGGQISTVAGWPRLSGAFESSVPGLFFTGLAAAATFGPMLRFVVGSGFAGPQVAEGVVGRLAAR